MEIRYQVSHMIHNLPTAQLDKPRHHRYSHVHVIPIGTVSRDPPSLKRLRTTLLVQPRPRVQRPRARHCISNLYKYSRYSNTSRQELPVILGGILSDEN